MEFETLVAGWEFLEAPRADDHGNLYFSDVTLGGLHRRRPDGRIDSYLSGRTWIGGIAFNDDGAVICSGKEGLVYFHPETGIVRSLAVEIDGQPGGAVNDFTPDDRGGVIAGLIDAASVGAGRAPEGRPLIRLDPAGRVTRLWEGITVSNGIGFSPDRRRLYQSESYRTLWVYDVVADGRLIDRRVFADIRDADGLAVDAEGGVWEVQSVSFGGPDLRDLYVATGSSFANPNNLTEKTGAIFRGRSPVPGLALPRTRFRP
jgi:sugar lactone lactonase YvrE